MSLFEKRGSRSPFRTPRKRLHPRETPHGQEPRKDSLPQLLSRSGLESVRSSVQGPPAVRERREDRNVAKSATDRGAIMHNVKGRAGPFHLGSTDTEKQDRLLSGLHSEVDRNLIDQLLLLQLRLRLCLGPHRNGDSNRDNGDYRKHHNKHRAGFLLHLIGRVDGVRR